MGSGDPLNEEVWDTREWRETVYRHVTNTGAYGMTWSELADASGRHHGSTSGALSTLHKQGDIARLTDKREGRKIYVGTPYINGRPIEEHGRRRSCPHCGGDL